MRMKRKGLTFIEVVVAISILAILVAVTLPIIDSSKRRSRQVTCQSNLRQMHSAIELYRSDWSGQAYGNLYQMGLPPQPLMDTLPVVRLLDCNGEGRPNYHAHGGLSYMYVPTPPGRDTWFRQEWTKYLAEQNEQAILAFDLYHNPPNLNVGSPGNIKTALAIRLSGAAVTQRKRGDVYSPMWWNQ